MELSLKNIGKINEASVEIKGITVIAGENNTGKSTIGKALFSVFNSFYNINHQVNQQRIDNIERFLAFMYRDVTNRLTSRVGFSEIAENIVNKMDLYRNDINAFKEFVIQSILQYDEFFEKYTDDEEIDKTIHVIFDGLNVSNEEVFKTVLNKNLDMEFRSQVNNVFNDEAGEIQLKIKDQIITIVIDENEVKTIDNSIDLRTEAIYIDDPFVLDANPVRFIHGQSHFYYNHREHLINKLFSRKKEQNVIDEIVTNNKFNNVYDKVNEVCSGEIVKGPGMSGWTYKKADKKFNVVNISTGLKTFVILKTLLLNGVLENNGTVILDEPEIHLHPEWQLAFAELIVLLQKEFDMHILLNTHSPYFLNAIEVYAAKHCVEEKCKYYLTESKGDIADLEDVTNEVERIYAKLARPLQVLENERYRDDSY